MRNQNDRGKQAGSGRKAAFSDRKAFSGAKRSAGERRPGGADRFSGERRSFDRTRPSGEKRFSETKRFQEGRRDAERRRMPEGERPAGGTRGSYHEYEYAPVSCAAPVPGETAQRDGEESYILTGRNPIREALKNDRDLEKLLVQKGDLSGSAMEIIHMAKERKIMVQVVDKSRLDEIDPHHQGLIAFASAFHYAEVEDMLRLAEERQEAPFLILLDGITDPHNLGAIIRTAECVGAHGVIVPQHRNVGLTPAAVKASAVCSGLPAGFLFRRDCDRDRRGRIRHFAADGRNMRPVRFIAHAGAYRQPERLRCRRRDHVPRHGLQGKRLKLNHHGKQVHRIGRVRNGTVPAGNQPLFRAYG